MRRQAHPVGKILAAIATLLILALANTANATPIIVTGQFLSLNNVFGANPQIRFGAGSVTPNGTDAPIATTGVATTTNIDTGALVQRNINFNPGPLSPNFFSGNILDNAALHGQWTLTFSNGTDTLPIVMTLPAGVQQAPFVQSITLSGTSDHPTFSWTAPAGAVVNGYSINITDLTPTPSGGVTGTVAFVTLPPTTTSYTVRDIDFPNPNYQFTLGTHYSIQIILDQTRDGTSNLGAPNIYAQSRVTANFTPLPNGSPAVNLPMASVAPGGGWFYQYNVAVVPGITYYFDPLVAIGYDFQIGVGNPNFASVVLPTGIGDSLYDLYGFDALNNLVLLVHDLQGGTIYDFTSVDPGGVDRFRVLGIETSAGLDPANTTAFITGLTFTGAGEFTGTQIPITAEVSAVPEPGTLLLFVSALGAFGFVRRRKAKA